MTANILKQIGIILCAIAAIGQELMGKTAIVVEVNKPSDDDTGTTDGGEPAKRGRGRPPKTSAVAAETPGEDADAPTGGKTYEELRAMIDPLVKGGQGADVKKIIAKYATDLKELATKPEKHADFEKDIDAISY